MTQQNETSSNVIIIDGLSPEEGAMSQALYSRRPQSILSHLEQIWKKGAQGFMETWYTGYGHNSIGDCGSTTLYFEHVSMLAAKAIQNNPLYNGQEASTRYLDFAGRMMVNPLAGLPNAKYLYIPKENLNAASLIDAPSFFSEKYKKFANESASEQGKIIQETWMAFYEKSMPIVKKYVAELNPKSDDQTDSQYDKAVNARAFDIMRGFIPAGMTTLVSWHSNIRQLRDNLAILKYHPSTEVARIAMTALAGLKAVYPASFDKKVYDKTEEYYQMLAEEFSYTEWALEPEYISKGFEIIGNFDTEIIKKDFRKVLENRPEKTIPPHQLGRAGEINVSFMIDFGSFRDAQRHRKGVCMMPLLTTKYGFHSWYLERLPQEVRIEAEKLIAEMDILINALPCADVERQYYIPMGYKVPADFTWSFDQCIYVAELRSATTVHPTFRIHAQALGRWIEETVPYAKLYVDYSEDTWSYKRGSQDITEKQ